jgi:hypothetical protein
LFSIVTSTCCYNFLSSCTGCCVQRHLEITGHLISISNLWQNVTTLVSEPNDTVDQQLLGNARFPSDSYGYFMTQLQLALKILISISLPSTKAFSQHISFQTAQLNCLLSLM